MAEVGEVFLQIDDVEAEWTRLGRVHLEEKPVGVSFGVDVILQNQVKFTRWRVYPLENVHQIASFKARVEPDLLSTTTYVLKLI